MKINPRRAAGGGVYLGTPFRLFADISAVVGTPVHASFPHMWKFQTQVVQGQVTRSRQAASRQKRSLNARRSCIEWPITLKLSPIDIRNSNYEMSLGILISVTRVKSILRPLILG